MSVAPKCPIFLRKTQSTRLDAALQLGDVLYSSHCFAKLSRRHTVKSLQGNENATALLRTSNVNVYDRVDCSALYALVTGFNYWRAFR